MVYTRLKNLVRKAREQESGFSLTELVISVFIIGLIASVALPILHSGAARSGDVKVNTAVGLRMQKDIEYLRANPTCAAINTLASGTGVTSTTSVTSNRSYTYKGTLVTSTGSAYCAPGVLLTVTFNATSNSKNIATRSVQLFTATEVGNSTVLP